jgi:hypothetical protein
MILVARPRLRSTTAERPTRNQAVQIFQNGANLGFVYAGGGLHPMQMLDWGNPRPGLRRWVGASWAVKDDMSWRAGWAAIHDDGSVSFAARVGGHRVSRTEAAPPNDIAETAVETVVADFMGALKATAEHYGLGEYDVRVGIESREQARIVIQTTNFRGFAYDAESTPLVRYTPITTSVYADASSDDFYRQVEVLALECVNQGGVRDLTHINAPEI